jgi:hypothetical protein
MKIVCIVEIKNNVVDTLECFVGDNEAGIIMRGAHSNKRVEVAAEKLFTHILTKHGVSDENIEDAIMDGYYEFDETYSLCITHPVIIHGA